MVLFEGGTVEAEIGLENEIVVICGG